MILLTTASPRRAGPDSLGFFVSLLQVRSQRLSIIIRLTLLSNHRSTNRRAQPLRSGSGLGSFERIRCHAIFGSISACLYPQHQRRPAVTAESSHQDGPSWPSNILQQSSPTRYEYPWWSSSGFRARRCCWISSTFSSRYTSIFSASHEPTTKTEYAIATPVLSAALVEWQSWDIVLVNPTPGCIVARGGRRIRILPVILYVRVPLVC